MFPPSRAFAHLHAHAPCARVVRARTCPRPRACAPATHTACARARACAVVRCWCRHQPVVPSIDKWTQRVQLMKIRNLRNALNKSSFIFCLESAADAFRRFGGDTSACTAGVSPSGLVADSDSQPPSSTPAAPTLPARGLGTPPPLPHTPASKAYSSHLEAGHCSACFFLRLLPKLNRISIM